MSGAPDSLGGVTDLQPLMFGIDWMDPNWLLDQFGPWFLWVSLLIVLVECGLFFPFLPGDTLLFAIGLFVATRDGIVPGPHVTDLVVAILLLIGAGFAGNVLGYEIGRWIGPPLYERNGRILEAQVLRRDQRLLRQARQQGAGDRQVRAVRAHLHHRCRRRDPDEEGPLLRLERRGRRSLGPQHHADGVLPRPQLPGPGREHRQGDHRDPRLLGHPDRLRVVEAPPGGGCRGPRELTPRRQASTPGGVQLSLGQHRSHLEAGVRERVLSLRAPVDRTDHGLDDRPASRSARVASRTAPPVVVRQRSMTVKTLSATTGATNLLTWFNIGNVPHVLVRESMQQFAAEVMPHLQ